MVQTFSLGPKYRPLRARRRAWARPCRPCLSFRSRSLRALFAGSARSKARQHHSDIRDGREFAVHSLLEHDILDPSSSERPRSFACSGICLSTRNMRTIPGHITLAQTPCLAPSLATTLQSPRRPCFRRLGLFRKVPQKDDDGAERLGRSAQRGGSVARLTFQGQRRWAI